MTIRYHFTPNGAKRCAVDEENPQSTGCQYGNQPHSPDLETTSPYELAYWEAERRAEFREDFFDKHSKNELVGSNKSLPTERYRLDAPYSWDEKEKEIFYQLQNAWMYENLKT